MGERDLIFHKKKKKSQNSIRIVNDSHFFKFFKKFKDYIHLTKYYMYQKGETFIFTFLITLVKR